MSKPLVSIAIPTLNADKVLIDCLKSIKKQNYPQSKIEIIIADGGSIDNTLQIAKKYQSKIITNPLVTAEAGKATAVKLCHGEFIALIDSDNILPSANWLNQMILPLLNDPKIIGSEPIRFTYRRRAGFIERYSALIGANDPYAFFSGIYDRYSLLTHKWTNLPIPQKKFLHYTKIILKPNTPLPTIGANGTVFRSTFLKSLINNHNYLFDIDILTQYLHQTNSLPYFAKTHNSIIHTFCENSIIKFYRKQLRRVRDFYFYSSYRSFEWTKNNQFNQSLFVLYSISLIFPLKDAFRGYLFKPDPAWFFHPLACLITTFIYTSSSFLFKLGIKKSTNRQLWQ